MQPTYLSKQNRLFFILAGFFLTNALLAELIGGKIFSLERVFNLPPANLTLFGQEHINFSMTCGVLLWPIVFILTDIINEYFGKRGVRFLSFMTVGFIIFSFLAIYIAIGLPPVDFYVTSGVDRGVPDMNLAFSSIFGQGLWIIVGSLVAFLLGQIIDVTIFHKIRSYTGEKQLWLRANVSTVVSQLIDSFVVLFIAFYLSHRFTLQQVFAIATVNFIYKATVAMVLTPFLYIFHNWIDSYLGKDLSLEMQKHAAM